VQICSGGKVIWTGR